MSDEGLLAEQIAYYRARAAEYDVTAYGDVAAAATRIDRIVDGFGPLGDVLEIACGTGMWTRALGTRASSVLAIDSSPEAMAIARMRVDAASVRFDVVDVFEWGPDRRFDTVFFSAWLSHVPASRFDEFWVRVRTWLEPDGRVLFIDEPIEQAGKEAFVESEVVVRTLDDGSTHRVVKNFVDPDALARQLGALGWQVESHLDRDDWLVSCARRR
jgi:demethylmenaquinone methyltransferase/2-methoxy-6-polyprenyl-1,4-benzoquinol methylase